MAPIARLVQLVVLMGSVIGEFRIMELVLIVVQNLFMDQLVKPALVMDLIVLMVSLEMVPVNFVLLEAMDLHAHYVIL